MYVKTIFNGGPSTIRRELCLVQHCVAIEEYPGNKSTIVYYPNYMSVPIIICNVLLTIENNKVVNPCSSETGLITETGLEYDSSK